MVGVRFIIPFPKPKTQLERCLKWIKLCGNAKLSKPSDATRNHYIYTKHFLGPDGPTAEHPDPVPAIGGETETTHIISRNIKRPPPKPRTCEQPTKRIEIAKHKTEDETPSAVDGDLRMKDIDISQLCRSVEIRTDICMSDLGGYMKNVQNNDAEMKRKFINDDIIKNDKSCKFYTGKYHCRAD